MRNCYKNFYRFAAALVVFFLMVLPVEKAQASHIAGGEITYEALNDTDYIITLTMYRDCRGVNIPNSNRSVRIFELCSNGGTGTSWTNPYATVSLPLQNTGGTEVSQLCQFAIDSSFCVSDATKRKYQGLEKFTYMDTVTLPFKCNTWYIGHSFFARNSAVVNANATNRNFYTQATIYTANRDSNSSPIFTADPTPYFCLGNPATYNYAVVENDGDSLEFALVATESAYGTALSYNFPYSATSPLDATNFNGTTGQLSFTPTTSGLFIVAMQITEYDRTTKKKVGEVRRDVQFFIDPCNANSNPNMVTGGVYNITGGSKVDSLTINTLKSATLVYDLSFSDANSGDTLTTTTNAAIALTGSTVTNKGVNPDTTTISWNPGTGATNSKYTVTYFSKDDNCPVAAATSVAVDIVIIDSLTSVTIAGVKESCNNSADGTLTANHTGGIGPYGYVWYKQGVKISDNTKTITGISANISYSVTVIDSFNLDSVLSTGFNLAATLPVEVVASTVTDIGCAGGCTGEIDITTVVGGNTSVPGVNGYQYKWSGTTNTTANPSSLCAGIHLVTVTDDNGCDTTKRFVINRPYAFDAIMVDSTDVSCKGGSDGAATVRVDVTECGTTTDPCNTSTLDTVGTGTTGHDGISLPSPYSTTNNVKQQYLFRKSELNAAGITGGTKISSLAFFITNWNFQTQTKEFSIALGCTSNDTLSSTDFEDGLLEVYTSSAETYSFTSSNNWKNHTFSNSFVWCGDSNLVIEICYKNDNANGIHLSPSVQTTTTTFRAANWFTDGAEDACIKDTVIGSSMVRPNIRLGWCEPEPTYVWSPSGGSDSNATGLSAGTYKVVVTSESSCKDSATVEIEEPPTGITLSHTIIQNILCAGATNGSASVQVTGGTAPYTFTWPTGVLTPTHDSVATNLGGGTTYSVTVTDSKGCTETEDITLNNPSEMFFTGSTVSNVKCNGGADGSITVTVTGGTSPITNYAWSHGPNGAGFSTVTSLSANNYTVTVTDNAGCTKDTTFAVTEPATALSANLVITQQVTCKGGNDGIAIVTPSGGTPTFTYNWSTGVAGATDSIRTTLSAGAVAVTVTDVNGCTATANATVTEPATGITAAFTQQTNVSCNGGNDGQLIVTPSGGTTPYTYAWTSGVAGTTDSIRTVLSAGSVTVTVTDDNGCTATANTTITEPATALSGSFTDTLLPACNGQSNGALIVTPAGGTAGYTYAWSTGTAGPTDSVRTGLSAGPVTVTITDNNGCQTTVNMTLTEPTALSVSYTSVTNPSCAGGSDGQVIATPVGGTPGFTYAWSAGVAGTTDSIRTGLSAAAISVTVTDANGCTANTSTTLTAPAGLTATVTITKNVSCIGGSDGEASATPTGGTAGYTYVWSKGTAGTNDSLRVGLDQGSVSVTITDSKGCQATASGNVTQPATGVTATFTQQTNVSCNGGSDGQLIVTPSGGTTPYTYAWSSGTVGTTDSIRTGLSAGLVTVTVTDGGGCTTTATTTITQPATALSASFTNTTHPLCNGASTGTVTVTPTGGTAGYTYAWSAGVAGTTDSIRNGLAAGLISVTVTDANGCQTTVNTTLNDPAALSVTISDTTHPLCSGGSTGQVIATPTGGTGTLTYAWSTGTAGTTDSIRVNLAAGLVSVTVTDQNGCTATASVTLIDPPAFSGTVAITQNVTCRNGSDGTASATPSGGTGPYTYAWSSGTAGSNDSLRVGLAAGLVTVTITDNNGCTTTASNTVTQPATGISISFTGQTNVLCNGDSTGEAIITPTGGTPGYTYNWDGGQPGATDSIRNTLRAGVIRVTVTDNQGCSVVDSTTITEPASGVFGSFTSVTDPSCSGTPNGQAIVTPSGGVGPYTYAWSSGTAGTTDSIRTALGGGALQVTITDNNGCTFVADTTLTSPSTLSSSFTQTSDPSCNGVSDGSLTVTPSGGTPGYTYAWSHGASGTTDSIRISLPGNTSISVTVTDASGCTSVSSTTLTEPTALTMNFTDSTRIRCNGASTGSITVTPGGGTPGYTYNWTTGVTTGTTDSIAINLSGNTIYAVTITDSRGCTKADSMSLSEPPAFSGSFTDSTTIACNGDATGSLTVTPTGGTPGYTYTWPTGVTTGATDSIATGLSANIAYTVTITDANSCTTTVTQTMGEPSAISITENVVNTRCGSNNGVITLFISGGTPQIPGPPYTIAWDSAGTPLPGTLPVLNNLYAGSYTATVTDGNGCTASKTITVSNRNAPTIALDSVVDATCAGVCDGAIFVNVTGGNGTITYSWSNGTTNQDLTNACAGVYTLQATDTAGCISFYTDTVDVKKVVTTTITQTPLSCGGAICDGKLVVAPSGGTVPYQYQWSTSATDTLDSLVNLCAGKYLVTVTDVDGCQVVDSSTLVSPAVVTPFASADSVSCFGGSNGVARVDSVQGGSMPYRYQWSSGVNDTLVSVSGLSAGQYIVTVTEAGGCTGLDTVDVHEPLDISSTFVTVDADCGVANGVVTASPSGGNGGYSYNWPVGGITTNATDSFYAVGTYNVVITDSKGCTKTLPFTINNKNAPVVTLDSVRNESCPGACDGGIFVSVTGGNPNYLFAWTPGGAGTEDIDSVCPGAYQLQVTDQSGCITFYNDTIDSATTVIVNASVVSHATTNGACDGVATANPTGGQSPYNFSWSSSATTDTAKSLCAGKHYVTVTDDNGCSYVDSVEITEPQTLVLDSSHVTNPDCNANPCNGRVFIKVSGGSGTYTYAWDNGDAADTSTLRCAGLASVTVSDGSISTVFNFPLSNTPGPSISTFAQDVSCNGSNDGVGAGVLVSGGPVTWSWPSLGATTDTVRNLSAGTYEVRAIDTLGCIAVDTVVIDEPSAIQVSFAQTRPNCTQSNGQIAATITGGTPNYTQNWLDASKAPLVPPQTGTTATGLAAGIYYLSIEDNNGCRDTVQNILNDDNAPVVSLDSLVIETCAGVCDGGIFISVTGGTGNPSYSWSNSSSSQDLTPVCPNTYDVTVTDGAGCQSFYSNTITGPDSLKTTMTLIATTSGVGQCDGQASVSVTGGTGTITYSWTGGSTSSSALNLCAGMNYVTVTDSNGCSTIDSVLMTDPVVLQLDSSQTTSPDCGVCDGVARVFISGGVGPYTYAWDNGDSKDSTTSRCAGVVQVTVTDNNGLQGIFTLGISNSSGAATSVAKTDVSCFGACDGSATVTASGGSPNYTYNWPTLGKTTPTVTSLCEGVYLVEVRDAKGCITVDSADIDEPTQIVSVSATVDANCGQSDGSVSMTTSGGSGGYTYKWSTGTTNTTGSLSNLSAGAYDVTVEDNSGCSRVFTFDINNPTGPTVVIDAVTDVTCPSDCDGAIFITASGTSTPYSYEWIPGNITNEDLSNACAGIYRVEVTDANNCVTIVEDTINTPAGPGLQASIVSHATAFGVCDGVASATVSSGTGMQYSWSSGAVGATASNLCSGINYVTVTTPDGCQYVDSVVVLQPKQLIIATQTNTNPDCNVCNGKVKITVAGGTPPYSYLWDNGDTADSTTNRCAGPLVVTVTDSKNYSAVFMLGLTNTSSPGVAIITTDATCFEGCNGMAVAQGSGTVGPYTYNWPGTGQQNDTATGLCAGVHLVQVTDKVGCVSVDSAVIAEPFDFDIRFDRTLAICQFANGKAEAIVTGATPKTTGYDYLWLDGNKAPIVPNQTNSELSNIVAGLYHVEVTDSLGCVDTAAVTINNIGGVPISLEKIVHSTCPETCDGEIGIKAFDGGTANYLWLETGDTTVSIDGLCAGDYTIEVTDTNNCKTVSTFTIQAPDSISIVFSNVTDASCLNTNDGAATTFFAQPGTYTYMWTGPENFISLSKDISNVLTGRYFLEVTDGNGCKATDSVDVGVRIYYELTSTPDTTYCESIEAVRLEVQTTSIGTYTTRWYDRAGNVIGKQDTVTVVPTTGENIYYAEVREDVCVRLDTVVINLGDSFVVNAGEDRTIVKGQRTTLGGEPTAPAGKVVEWVPPVGLDNANVMNPVASPDTTTTYILIAGDEATCVKYDTVTVTLSTIIKVNDGFTPNGDGVNDLWDITLLEEYPNAKVQIFNRWGQLLYESEPYIPWDGTVDGEPMPLGTYYYIIDLKDTSLENPVISGPVTIIR